MERSVVIFDLDGTLTRPCLDFDLIRAELGVEGPILEAIAALDVASRAEAEAILMRHERAAAENAVLQEGAVQTIEACRRAGYAVAVLTRNALATAQLVLTTHGLSVDALRTREDGAIKPSPDSVRAICMELHASPARSWMVGDHAFDIQAGRSAGTRTILMLGDRPAPDYADQADHVIRRLPDVLPVLGISDGDTRV